MATPKKILLSDYRNAGNEQLIHACRSGDRQAQYAVYRQYARAMLNTAYRIVNCQEDAEDVLQEAFLKAFTHLDQYREDATFGAWLKRIVVNAALSQLRKKQLVFEELADDTNDIPVEEVEETGETEIGIEDAYQALHQLADGYRTIFSLYVLEGYDHNEIAEILDITPSTSISQLSRARKRLREILIERRIRSWTR